MLRVLHTILYYRAMICCLVIVDATAAKASDQNSITDYAIKQNRKISKRINKIAENLDLYLSRNSIASEVNETSLSLIYHTELRERESLEQEFDADFRLRLHHFERKFKVELSSYDSEDEFQNLDRQSTVRARKSYGTSVSVAEDYGDFQISYRPRMEFSPKVGLSHTLKLRHQKTNGSLKFQEHIKLFAKANDGTGVSGGIYFIYSLLDNLFINFLNDGKYLDQAVLFTASHEASLLYQVHHRFSVTPGIIYHFNDNPVYRMTNYISFISFKHVLYKDILNYKLTPDIKFARNNKYSGQLGLRFSLEVLF